jgi:hypothetical protein
VSPERRNPTEPAHIRLERLAFATSLALVVVIFATVAPGMQTAPETGDRATHSHGSPCPDPTESGDPCGPGCGCTCCPGHATAPAFVPRRLSLGLPPPGEFGVQSDDDLHWTNFLFRIFRPPRA